MNRCIYCGLETLNGYPLCNSCKPNQLTFRSVCKQCGILTSSFVCLCSWCMDMSKNCNNTSLFMYRGKPKDLLKQYKFNKDFSFAKYYAELIIDIVYKRFNDYTICPIPTSYVKRRLKGWYHLDLIIDYLKKSSIPTTDILGKRYGKTQKRLNREERWKNLKDNYYIKSNNIPEKILLLDDVYTTGATVETCYKLLKPFSETIQSLTLYRD